MANIGTDFLKGSNLPLAEESAESQNLPQPPLAWEPGDDAELIDLPEPSSVEVGEVDLLELIQERRTLRRYTDEPLTLAELSYLLWVTQGVKRVTPRPVTLRTVPSAGARHAFETLLLVNRVEGLEPGLYKYAALQHKLVMVNPDPTLADRLTAACLDQPHVKNSAVTFIWEAVVERMIYRYGMRGYRYLLLDAGHVCQNLYLGAESIGCGVCALDAFEDATVNDILNLDGEENFAIYMGTLGKRG